MACKLAKHPWLRRAFNCPVPRQGTLGISVEVNKGDAADKQLLAEGLPLYQQAGCDYAIISTVPGNKQLAMLETLESPLPFAAGLKGSPLFESINNIPAWQGYGVCVYQMSHLSTMKDNGLPVVALDIESMVSAYVYGREKLDEAALREGLRYWQQKVMYYLHPCVASYRVGRRKQQENYLRILCSCLAHTRIIDTNYGRHASVFRPFNAEGREVNVRLSSEGVLYELYLYDDDAHQFWGPDCVPALLSELLPGKDVVLYPGQAKFVAVGTDLARRMNK